MINRKWSIRFPGRTATLLPMPNIHEMPLDGGRDSHAGRDEMCPATGPLAALKIPVTGRGTPFARLQDIGVHRQAHAAACLPPFESGFPKDPVQSFGFGLLFYET